MQSDLRNRYCQPNFITVNPEHLLGTQIVSFRASATPLKNLLPEHLLPNIRTIMSKDYTQKFLPCSIDKSK